MVRAVGVRQEVGERLHLADDWAVLEDFSHDVLWLVSDAKVVHSVKLRLDTANVGFKMVNFAFCFLSGVRHTLVQDESFGFSPFQNFVDVSSIASE